MKKLIVLISLVASMNAFAQFEAVVDKESDSLIVSIADNVNLPPYEAGKIWSVIRGLDQRKYVTETGFNLVCDGLKNSTIQIYGECKLIIPMNLLNPVRDGLVFKRTGAAAARLNRYFTDSAYVLIQGGGAYLSSYNTRREFSFGIKESLIKR